MSASDEHHERGDVQRAVRRDFQRRDRAEDAATSFWQGLRVLGMVGWPIALATLAGTFLGRYLDQTFQTGVRWTLIGLTTGAMVGSHVAWRALRGSAMR